jgi:hypothetical protein
VLSLLEVRIRVQEEHFRQLRITKTKQNKTKQNKTKQNKRISTVSERSVEKLNKNQADKHRSSETKTVKAQQNIKERRESEKGLWDLATVEEVWQVLHGVAAQHRNIPKLARVLPVPKKSGKQRQATAAVAISQALSHTIVTQSQQHK